MGLVDRLVASPGGERRQQLLNDPAEAENTAAATAVRDTRDELSGSDNERHQPSIHWPVRVAGFSSDASGAIHKRLCSEFKRKIMKSIALIAAASATLFAAPAFAHPKLVSSSPANGATAGKTNMVTLNFSEKLVPSFTGASLAMTGMAGKKHTPMPIATAKPAFGKDGKSMILTANSPLVPGDYKVDWHVVGADTHRITGSVAFTVR